MTPDQIAQLPYRPCVGVCLIDGQGRIFGGTRLDMPGAWQMPQGGIDPGETPTQAALRELWEETGVTQDKAQILAESADWHRYQLPHDLVPKLWKGRFQGQEQKWFLMRLLGSDADIDITQEPREFGSWQWMGRVEMLANIVPFKRDLYDIVLTEFAAHLAD